MSMFAFWAGEAIAFQPLLWLCLNKHVNKSGSVTCTVYISFLTLSDLNSSIRTGNSWSKLVPFAEDKTDEIETSY